MRFDTHRVSTHLVSEFQRERPRLEVTDDGGDIIHIAFEDGSETRLYLIEDAMEVYEVSGIVNANSGKGIYSVFVLWCDMLVPHDGLRCRPDPWLAALLALGGNKLYAFDAYYGEEFYVFTVHFEPTAAGDYMVRYGASINARRLSGTILNSQSPHLNGRLYAGRFEVDHAPSVGRVSPALQPFFDLLGLANDADRAAVKRAYRTLARRWHPDQSRDPSAHERMQRLNEAYTRLLAIFDDAAATPPIKPPDDAR